MVVLVVWLLVVIITTLVTFILPESFSSTARIRIERDQSDISELGGRGGGMMPYDPYFIQTEFELIQSELILGRVIEELDLNNVWGKKYASGDRLKTPESITLLKGRMDLRPVRNTSLIEIRIYSEKAEEAAKIANAVAGAYKGHRLAQRTKWSKGGIAALEERFAEQEEKLRKAREHVDELRVQLSISDAKAFGDGASPALSAESPRRLEVMRIESKAEQVRQAALLNSLASVQRELGPDALAQAISTAAPDRVLATLQERLGAAEQQIVGLRKESGSNHAAVVKSEAVADDLRSKIRSRVDGIMLGLSTRVLSLSNSLDNLEKEVERATTNDVARANQTRPYFLAKRRLEELERFRQILDMKIAAEKIDVELPKTMMVEIVDKAQPGLRPVRPNKPLNIAVGIIVGGVAGFVLATLAYALEWRASRRMGGAPQPPFLRRFRAIVYLLIALVLAVVLGCLLATPLSYSAGFCVPLALFVGGIASAFIALANLKSETTPRQTEPMTPP